MTHATISLAKNSSGADVTEWQQLLGGAGFPVAVTGTFDAATDAATKKWQASVGFTGGDVDGVVGPKSWAKMTGAAAPPPASSNPPLPAPKTDKNAQFGRDALLEAWPTILSEAAASQYPEVRALGAMGMPNLSELQIAGAMAQLESVYGKSPYTNKLTGETQVLNNWGAIQAGKPPCNPATSFEVSDTGASGQYNFCYKKYATPADGALDFVRQLTVKRPASWKIMRTGDIDAYSIQMHSWKPPLTQLGAGKPAGTVQNLDPITKTPGYFEQPPVFGKNSRAFGLAYRAADIAHTLGEPLMAKRGGPILQGGGNGIPSPWNPGGGVSTSEGAGGGATAARGAFFVAVLGGLGWWAYKIWGPK